MMATVGEALASAQKHHQAGQLSQAEHIYLQILGIEPLNAEVLHLIGVIAIQCGKIDLSVEFIKRAIEVRPMAPEFHNSLGWAFGGGGQFDLAVTSFEQALEIRPEYTEARINLGNALRLQGKFDEAVASFRCVLQMKPDSAEAYSNLGTSLHQIGKLDEAVSCCRQALDIKPDYSEAHFNLGSALQDQGSLDDALACYRRASRLNPRYFEAYISIGIVLQKQGKLDEAVSIYRLALQVKPDSAEAHNNLGVALHSIGKLDEASESYLRSMQIRPDFPEAHINLGSTYREQGRLDAAADSTRRALELNPRSVEAYNNLGSIFKLQGKLDEAIDCYHCALKIKPGHNATYSNLLYTLNFHTGYDAQNIYDEHHRWSQFVATPLKTSWLPHDNVPLVNRRLRVGYVSPDFRDHVVGRNLLPLFREHDRDQFDIFCYSQVLCPDDISDRFQRYADTWRNIVGKTDMEVSNMIRHDRIDILVDLTLHMANNRLLVFARKPAPVQVTFAGYPGTTGLDAIDYRLTDHHLDPPGSDGHYSEEPIRLLDSFWCYDPPLDNPIVNNLPVLDKGHITFGCYNNFCKVNDSVLILWARLLRAIDRSQIMILASEGSHRQTTLDRLKHEGISPNRVTFVPQQPLRKYLELYHHLDIALDTFPYNGHTTSLDSLWMGVPLVTLVGQTVVGRAGLSQLSNLGLTELIARTPDEFLRIASDLANDFSRLSKMRESLRECLQNSPLMNAARFARNIEAAYRTMWQRWCISKRP